jgi:hypothetical protein
MIYKGALILMIKKVRKRQKTVPEKLVDSGEIGDHGQLVHRPASCHVLLYLHNISFLYKIL